METVGQRIRWARERAGVTLAELALKTGMTAAAISRIETGATKPRPTTIRRLADELGVRIAWVTVGEMPPVEKGGME